jgi:hypothetical protein
MTAALVNGTYNPPDVSTGGQANPSVCGCTTSGGTESIVLAIKAHRDYYCRRHGIQRPELVACTTAHAAVDKACEMLGITLIKVQVHVPRPTHHLKPVVTRWWITRVDPPPRAGAHGPRHMPRVPPRRAACRRSQHGDDLLIRPHLPAR